MSAFKLPEPVIDRLLDKLGNDDAFRDQFLADPRAALTTLGFEAAADSSVKLGLWECLTVDRLASKQAIRQGHEQLRRQLKAEFVFFPFTIGIRESTEKAAA